MNTAVFRILHKSVPAAIYVDDDLFRGPGGRAVVFLWARVVRVFLRFDPRQRSLVYSRVRELA